MRILQAQEAQQLLRNFPQTRLSYEVNVHKKDETYENKCFIIPKGRKCIAWATEWNRQKMIAIIEITPNIQKHNSNNNSHSHSHSHHDKYSMNSSDPFVRDNGWIPGQVSVYDVCFHASLSYGTVFGGTMFRTAKTQCFCIQQIYWYKGSRVPPLYFSDYIQMCERIFNEKDIVQISYTTSGLIFGLPVMCDTDDDAICSIPSLPYSVYSIHYRSSTNPRVQQRVVLLSDSSYSNSMSQPQPQPQPQPTRQQHQNQPSRPQPIILIPKQVTKPIQVLFIKPNDESLTNIQAVFMVRPNIQNDVYDLFVVSNKAKGQGHNDEYVFHNLAHIPSYKTSVMMNSLFRTIKENARLDTMEESDDEDEFENIEPDKFVSLHKEYKMVCRLNKKFCKWVPIQVVVNVGMGVGIGAPMVQDVITEMFVKQHELRYIPKKYIPRR